MEITIKSYIKEKVKIELWQCSQNILSIDLSEGEDCVTDIDLPEYGKTEILVAVSYEEPEEAGNFLDHFLWGLYYLLDGDIGSPLDGESGMIGTKISGEFREDTALKLSCVGSSQSKGYVVTIECKENLEKSYYLRAGKESKRMEKTSIFCVANRSVCLYMRDAIWNPKSNSSYEYILRCCDFIVSRIIMCSVQRC